MKNENDEKKVEGKADLSVDELEDAAGGYAPRNTPQSTTDRPVIELEEAKKLLPYIFKDKSSGGFVHMRRRITYRVHKPPSPCVPVSEALR